MDTQDIRSLQILEELGNKESPSQRDLAKKLNISLGLANSFIKRLAKQGHIKITTVPRNRVRYILTPKGIAEKSQLTYRFIRYSLKFYKQVLRDFQEVLHQLKKMNVKSVVFYGATDLAEISFISLKDTDIKLVGVVDDFKEGDKFMGYTIQPTKALKRLEFDRVIITAIESKETMFTKLLRKKIPKERIFMLE